MGRNILAVVVGVVIGSFAIMIVEGFSHFLYPYPEGLDHSDQKAMAAYVATLPNAAILFVVLAHAVGAFVMAVVTTLIATSRQLLLSFVGGLVLMAGGVAMMFKIPHPDWFPFVDLLVYLPFAWFGSYLITRKN